MTERFRASLDRSKPKHDPAYRMERVMQEVEHPLFGRVEVPVTYIDKNGKTRVRMRRVRKEGPD